MITGIVYFNILAIHLLKWKMIESDKKIDTDLFENSLFS